MTKLEVPLPERVFSTDSQTARRATLHRLFRLVSRANSIETLKTSFVENATPHFQARRAALVLFTDFPWDELKPEIRDNPVVRYLFERHAPVHEAVVLEPGEWSALCPWSDHGHVLTGPIVRDGELIGALAFTRAQGETAFDDADLADASALCHHLCAWFARWDAVESLNADSLTPRERQITELVSQGLTNAQIGARLFVSSETVKAALKVVFRKTGVRSRAELAARHRV